MTVSPPFNISETLPGDNDIVSQHPPNARTMRDTVESWILWEHNVQGRHDQVRADWHTDATYPGIASVTTVWASSDDLGDLHKRQGTNAIEWVGVPPGTAFARFDASVPNGYVACNGAAISRTVAGVRLFALYGVTYGVGDGSSTFNLPNCTGRALVQLDASQSVVTGATSIGLAFGSNLKTIAQANLPAVNFTVSGISLNDPGHGHPWKGSTSGNADDNSGGLRFDFQNQFDAAAFNGVPTGTAGQQIGGNTTGISIATQGVAASGGSGTGLSVTQPGIVVNYVIKL